MTMPNEKLKSLLLKAYEPCQFFGRCREARWEPGSGHVPRGYLGATGTPEDVEVIMVLAEPGHPHANESYDASLGSNALISACTRHTYESLTNGTDLFHRNIRWFMSQLYPDMAFDEQLRRVWITEGGLCSVNKETGGLVRRPLCAKNYLMQQVKLLPNAVIVAFGGKAKYHLKLLNVDFINASALSPPEAKKPRAHESWENAINEIRKRRKK